MAPSVSLTQDTGGADCTDCTLGAEYAQDHSQGYVTSSSRSSGSSGSGSKCDDYCQWLHRPTPRQPSLDQRCGGRGWVPSSVCHKGAFTYADALELGSSNTDNWYWSCSYVMQMDPTRCEQRNPFANPHGLTAAFVVLSLFATAYTGGVVGVAAVPEALLFQATQDVSVLSGGSAALGGESAMDSIAGKLLGSLEYDGATTAESELAGALQDFCENSFSPDTAVLLADGKTKPIKDVAVGDQVVSTDPVTAVSLKEPVDQLHDNLDTRLADLTVAVDGRQQTMHTTQEHLVWDLSTRRWTPVAALGSGDRLATTSGATIRVVGLRSFTGARHMLNLTVSTLHTYYVLAGNTPVLVHNIPCGKVSLGNGLYQHPDGSIRDAAGHFAGTSGTRVGADAEASVWDKLQAQGRDVIRTPVAVRANGQLRIYDGAINVGNGRLIGIEVKSGTASLTADQRSFDTWLNTSGQTAPTVGQYSGEYDVVGVYQWNVP